MSRSAKPLSLPGWDLPINDREYDGDIIRFQHALARREKGLPLTRKEVVMLELINTLSDKPNWESKIFDTEITNRWHAEAVTHPSNLVTDATWQWVLGELQYKAKFFRSGSIIPVLDTYESVIKADGYISQELRQELVKACKPFTAIEGLAKDWHPGSNGLVHDIVHPSLYPLIYGRTQFTRTPYDSPAGALDPRFNCETLVGTYVDKEPDLVSYSSKFQWLPCEVKFDEEKNSSIVSYINNLHPVKHGDAYPIIEKFIDKAIPLWNLCLMGPITRDGRRVETENTAYDPERPQPVSWDDDDEVERARAQWESIRTLTHPEPEPWDDNEPDPRFNREDLDLKAEYEGLQIIVKIASVELTPEKPEYSGGSWHVEGMLNEQIVATAIYYFDSENITDCEIAFRFEADEERPMMEWHYEQGEYEALEEVYGRSLGQEGGIGQDMGGIKTPQGRMIAFPNTLQHRVGRFGLVDSTRPGHRRILVLWLVDPDRRIISTAHVPPQQRGWLQDRFNVSLNRISALPAELRDMIREHLEQPITHEEALEYRKELMEERSATHQDFVRNTDNNFFNFCEH